MFKSIDPSKFDPIQVASLYLFATGSAEEFGKDTKTERMGLANMAILIFLTAFVPLWL
jgi:hypothetical protein